MTIFYAQVEDALRSVTSGMRVFVHGGAATPQRLVDGVVAQAVRLRNVELIHLHTEGDAVYAKPEYSASFRVANIFVGSNMRQQLDGERVDYLPIFLSEIPKLFRSGRRKVDVALIHVSRPDGHGYCSLGVSVDIALAEQSPRKITEFERQIGKHFASLVEDGSTTISRNWCGARRGVGLIGRSPPPGYLHGDVVGRRAQTD